MATFSVYNPANPKTTLTDALLAPNSGITITSGSIALNASGTSAVNFYDGALAPLGIGAGLLLTSGTTPGTANTVGWFGTDNSGTSGFNNGEANINAVVNTVFQTQSYDATTLAFDFTVADPTATSVSFDLVFGSDEFPEWVDQFVDCAIVMVNGVNYALFNHDPLHPLSVVSSNLAAGYFQDNAGNVLPIEYDGVSHVLKIVAPIIPGATNHIEIGIGDTGDHIYDSGIFLANFSAGNIPGSGVVSSTDPCTDGIDNITGSTKDEYFDLKGGDDIAYAGAGDDIVVAGSGNDLVYGGSGADQMKGDAGDDDLDGGADVDTAIFSGASSNYVVAAVGGGFTITDSNSGPGSEGTDTLTSVELAKFSDGLFAIGPGGVLTPVSDPGTPPSNSPGSVTISGITSAGKTLTATVSDPDGISGAISYQWQVSNDGLNWSDVGANSNTYTVANGDVGKTIQVVASYVDSASQAEAPVSAAKAIQQVGDGDLVVTLIQLDAPEGASVINPLTTLVQDAIDFGLSPNTAALAIKTVLGLPANVNLQTYDAYVVLQGAPSDPTALAVEKIAVEVAILTSLSDDDTGTNLTLKILEAAANNQTLNLADANDLADILGIDITGITNKNDYPEPLREIFDRHENIDQASTVDDIEAEWQDFLSIQDNVASTSIADLSIHVNQAPAGAATANLVDGLVNAAYELSAADLLQGFSDAEDDTLSVSGLSADNGVVVDNGDGTFTITPAANYNGPVELTYSVIDGQGGATPASQMFVIAPSAPGNNAPTGTATAALAAGTEDVAYTVDASDLLAGFNDIDGDALSVSGLAADHGTVVDNGDDTFTITPAANYNGTVNLNYNVTDGTDSIAAVQSFSLAAANDGPTGTATAALAAGTEDVAYTVNLSDLLAGFNDIDGDALSVSGLAADHGTVVDNGDDTFTITPAANYNGTVNLNYNVTDGTDTIAAVQSFSLAAANDGPTGTATAALAAGTEDVAYTVNLSDLLAGFNDIDGDALSVSGLAADHGTVVDNGDDTFTITPAANYNGSVNLNYNVTDGTDSIAAVQSFSLAAANDGPTGTATAALAAGTEDVAYTVNLSDLLAGFNDIDGDALSVSGLAADHGTVVDNGDGTFTITPAANYNGSVNLNYDVTDGTDSIAALQSFSLAAANDGPTANPDTGSAGENETKSFSVLGNDTDPDFGDIKMLISIGTVTVSSANALVDNVNAASAVSIVGGQIQLSPGILFDPLGNGETATVVVNYTMSDAAGVPSSSALTLTINGAAEGPIFNVVNGTPGNDHKLNGTAVADQINGLSGNDLIDAKGGNDLITAGAGQDLVQAGSGDDTVIATIKDGEDLYFGGSGSDTFDFSQTSAAATVNLGTNDVGYATSKQIGTDVLVNFENVIGGSGSDAITGDSLENVLSGGGGNDTISGQRGNDQLAGDAGNDKLVGGRGSDLMTGGSGSDSFVFQAIQSQASDVDTIIDFVVGQDHLLLQGLSVTQLTEFDVNGDAVLDTSLTLNDGTTVQLLSVSDVSQWQLL